MSRIEQAERFAILEPKLDKTIVRVSDDPQYVAIRQRIEDMEAERRRIETQIEELRKANTEDHSQVQRDAQRLLSGEDLTDLEHISVVTLRRKADAIVEALGRLRAESAAIEQRVTEQRCEAVEGTVNRYLRVMLDAVEVAKKATQDVEALFGWIGSKKIILGRGRPGHWQLWDRETQFLLGVDNYTRQRRESMRTKAEREADLKYAKAGQILARNRR